jgi:hypothetical protein
LALSVGDRVCLSDLGRQRSPRMTQTGVITGAIGGAFYVLLDGAKSPVRLHHSYIVKVDNDSVPGRRTN